MFKEILLAVDLGEESSWGEALPVALRMVRDHKARLHIITVVPDFGFSLVGQYFPRDYEHSMITDVQRRLRDFVAAHIPDDMSVQDIVGHGPIYSEILNAARTVAADLIVMASHRPGLQDYLIGPNASRVVRHANCSVLVVRERNADSH